MKLFIWFLKTLEESDYYESFFKRFLGWNLEKLNEKKTRELLDGYLKQEYNLKTKYPYSIFHIINASLNKLSIEEVEEMAIESPYFESMPEQVVFNYLACGVLGKDVSILCNGALFKTYLTSCISGVDELISLVNNRAYVDQDYVFRLLASTCDASGLAYYSGKLRFSEDAKRLVNTVTDAGYFSLDELKQFFIKADCLDHIILDNLKRVYQRSDSEKEKNKIVDVVYELAEYAPDYVLNSEFVMRKNGKYAEGYESYATEIANSKDMPDEMKVRLAKKMLEEGNFEFLYYWFLEGVECSFNQDLIDAMLNENESVLTDLLISVHSSYLDYVVLQIISKGDEVLSHVMDLLCTGDSENLEIMRVDQILAILYHVHYDFKLSKDAAYACVLGGSSYTSKYLSEYEFTKEERDQILASYQFSPFYLSLYGAYLQTGDSSKLVELKRSKVLIEEMRLSRKKA